MEAVSTPFPGAVIASVVYISDGMIFGQYPSDGVQKGDGNPFDLKRLLEAAVEEAVPEQFALEQNYPNPFNPTTSIRFALPEEAHVKLFVYDMLGREVAMLVEGQIEAGVHEVVWNGRNAVGSMVASGVYLYRLEAGDFVRPSACCS